jgi:hypothetical protein
LLEPSSQKLFDLSFDLTPQNPLPMYCDAHGTGDVAMAVEADSCRLHISIVGPNKIPNQIARLWLEPPPEGLRMTTYGLADTANEPARWRIKGKSIDLNCRVSPNNKPATLILAPVQPLNPDSTLLSDYGLSVTQEGNKSIHGPVQDGEFFIRGASGTLICELQDKCNEIEVSSDNSFPISKRLLSDLSFPWLKFFQDTNQSPQFRYTRPGVAYRQQKGGSEVATLIFEGPEIAIPLLPFEWINSSSSDCKASLVSVLNNQMAHSSYTPSPIIHETHFLETPANPGQKTTLKSLFYVDSSSSSLKSLPQITHEPSVVDYGLAKVRADLGGLDQAKNQDEQSPRKYIVISREQLLEPSRTLFECLGDFTILPNHGSKDDVVGLLKLSRDMLLKDILAEAALSERADINAFHPSIQNRSWTGLILFGFSANCEQAKNNPVLKQIIPKEGVAITYIAITPKKGTNQARHSVCARIKWKNETTHPTASTGDAQREVRCLLKSLDVEWFDGAITSFGSMVELYFDAFFGQRDGNSTVSIEGHLDQATKTIRFTGAFAQPIQIIGPEKIKPFGPIKYVDIKAATIESIDGKASFSLDGSIRLGPWDGSGSSYFSDTNQGIDYKSLRIVLEDSLSKLGSWLNISYPSLRFPLSIPILKFLSFELSLDSLAVDWESNEAAWNSVLSFRGADLSFPSVRFGFRIDLMKLPLLAWKNLDRLTLEVLLGFNRHDIRIGIGFTGFECNGQELDLDLIRFLRLTISQVYWKDFPAAKLKALILHDISLEILEKSIFGGLEVLLFSAESGRHGFLAYIPSTPYKKPGDRDDKKDDSPKAGDKAGKEKGSHSALLKIKWILIAQNLRLPKELLASLMQLPAVDQSNSSSDAKCPDDLATENDQTFVAPIDSFAQLLVPSAEKTTLTDVDQWMFGAGFRVLSILEAKFLFQDGYYYGITIDSPLLCKWFGYNIGISVVYIKGSEPSGDEFTLSFRAPRISLPAFAFTGGVIQLQLGVDGSFLIDIGFPWIQNGVRRWDRALGAIVTPYQGSGGFYVRQQTVSGLREGGEDKKGVMFGAGFAVQFGFGGTYGNDIFHVSASIGIFAVTEGDALFIGNNLDGIHLIGSVGILGRASGELHWWIISIRIEVLLIAEARLQFVWGCDPRALPPPGQECDRQKPVLSFQVTVYASVTASACIGWGAFQICAGISLSIAIPISPDLRLTL